jgi:hypothetical protein
VSYVGVIMTREELLKRLDALEKEVDDMVAFNKFKLNDSYFINKRNNERAYRENQLLQVMSWQGIRHSNMAHGGR